MARKVSKHGENRLLAALSANERAALDGHFERVSLTARDILYKASRPFTAAYFPERGMISLVQPLEDGTTIEVGLIGREGFFGVPILLGARSSPVEAIVQGAGTALRISAGALLQATTRNEKLRKWLLQYAQALHIQVTQTAVCNGRHTLQERLARWLLEAGDRIDGGAMEISHEFLSYMLGCRRSGVTVALGKLKAEGIIEAARGHVRIDDRKRLERTACECYRTVQREFRRLLR